MPSPIQPPRPLARGQLCGIGKADNVAEPKIIMPSQSRARRKISSFDVYWRGLNIPRRPEKSASPPVRILPHPINWRKKLESLAPGFPSKFSVWPIPAVSPVEPNGLYERTVSNNKNPIPHRANEVMARLKALVEDMFKSSIKAWAYPAS